MSDKMNVGVPKNISEGKPMPQLDSIDIMSELVELFKDITKDIHLQLDYYRASVYKQETADTIKNKIDQLKLLAQILGNEGLQEAFLDFEATVINGNQKLIPGECFFSARVKNLLGDLSMIVAEVEKSTLKTTSCGAGKKEFSKSVQRHRRQLLSMCRQGSDHWSFFQYL
jgi:hypothetical protein